MATLSEALIAGIGHGTKIEFMNTRVDQSDVVIVYHCYKTVLQTILAFLSLEILIARYVH